jgi:uncharacterized LabA/DUF88 family protein
MVSNTSLDEIYADTWDRREENLGRMTYGQYLQSDHWQRIKEKARKRPNYKKCEFCTSTEVELHHTSYKWILTNNELLVIISLCREHHQQIHDLAKAKNISVRLATNILRKKYKPAYWRKNQIDE